MPGTMPAVVKFGCEDGEVELREVAVPEPGPGEVLLEVKAAGVCGSDIEQFRHAVSYDIPTPAIMGHEFAGVIAAVGAGADGWRSAHDLVESRQAAKVILNPT